MSLQRSNNWKHLKVSLWIYSYSVRFSKYLSVWRSLSLLGGWGTQKAQIIKKTRKPAGRLATLKTIANNLEILWNSRIFMNIQIFMFTDIRIHVHETYKYIYIYIYICVYIYYIYMYIYIYTCIYIYMLHLHIYSEYINM